MKFFNIFRRNNPFYGLAGAYMLYLVYTMFKGVSEVTGNARIATFIAIPVFAVFGIVLVAGYLLGRADDQKAKAEAAEQEAAEQAADAGKADAAGNPEANAATEEEKSRSGFAKAAAALDQLEDDDEA